MGIRPIDFQILYSKTSDIEKSQQMQQQQEKIQPQQVAAEQTIKKEIELKQVAKTAKGEGGKVEEKKEHEQGRRRKKEADEEGNDAGAERKRASVDITV